MRKQIAALVVAGTAAAGLFVAPPAQAEDTATTFELTASGDLAISVPASADLSSATTDAGTLSAALGSVTVTDARGALLSGGWTASVDGSDFVTGVGTADLTIADDFVDYWSGPATAFTGVAVTTPGQLTALLAQDLSAQRTAFAAVDVVGNNSTTWNPTIVVNIPSDSIAGVYTGTITHSAA